MIESGLHNLICASSVFTSLAGDRLFPVLLPDKALLPAATYQRVSTVPLYSLDERINFTESRIQFDTWADSYSQAKSLMAAVNAVLDNYAGDLVDGTHIFGIQLYSMTDLYESAARIYRVTADYKVQYADSI